MVMYDNKRRHVTKTSAFLFAIILLFRIGRATSTIEAFSLSFRRRRPLFGCGRSVKLFRTFAAVSTNRGGEDAAVDDSVAVAPQTEPNAVLTLRIETLTNLGWGIGRIELECSSPSTTTGATAAAIDNNDSNSRHDKGRKWVVMVPGVIAGEVVQVKIVRNYPNYSQGEVVKIVQSSPDRVKPGCRLFGDCGGCQLQHMSVPAQRQYKTDQIAEAFQKNGFRVIKTVDSTISHSAGEHDESDTSDDDDEDYVIAVKPCLGNDQVYGYRSKLTPHYYSQIPPTLKQQQATNEVDGGAESNKQQQVLGFQKLFSRQIVDVETCPIATDRVNQAYAELRKQILLQSTSAASKTPSMLIDAATTKRKATDANHKKNKKQRLGRRGGRGRNGNNKNRNSNNNKNRQRNRNNAGEATVLLRQADLNDPSGTVCQDHEVNITTTVNNLKFTYQAGNFFQNNYHLLPTMVDHVVQAASANIVRPDDDGTLIENIGKKNKRLTHLVDCYCGSGLFAVAAAPAFDKVVGIEINERAAREAAANAKQNDRQNCRFVAASADEIFNSIQEFPRASTVAVLDPPRKGCSDAFLKQLLAFGPARIVYLSCDVATQARDAKKVVRSGSYSVSTVQPFDLFPQTRHIESLMVFERKSCQGR